MHQLLAAKYLNPDYPMPDAWAACLAEAGYGPARIVWIVASDLDATRAYGRSYLVVTDDALLVLNDGAMGLRLARVEVQQLRVDELFGSACLVAQCVDGERPLIYYTKKLALEFGTLCRLYNVESTSDTAPAAGPIPGAIPEPESVAEPASGIDARLGATQCASCGRPLPERGARCPVCVSKRATLKRLVHLLQPYRWKILVVVLATFVAVLAQIAPPYVTKHIVDDVILPRDVAALPFWITVMALAGLTYLAARWLIGAWSAWLSARLIADLRARLHSHLQHLPLSYFSKRSSGDLVARVMQDTTELQQFLIEGLPYLFVNGLAFIAILAILLSLDVWLAVLVFLPVPLLVLGVNWVWRRMRPLFYQRNGYRGQLHAVLGESIDGVKAIKAATREQQRSAGFNGANERFFDAVKGIMQHFVGFAEGSFWLMSLGVTAVWAVAGWRLASGDPSLSLGDLLAFVGYIWLFYGPLQWFGVIMNWMNNAMAGAERIFTILDTPLERDDGALRQPALRGELRLTGVRFSYEKGKEVLKGVDLGVRAGEMIGLVGKSGAGKSTIINLLCRFYEPDAGQILLDGRPIRSYSLADLRRQIGIVMQDPFVFRGSIRDNIAYAVPEAPFSDVVRAAKAAHAHDFIMDKEFGYDSIIGEHGVQLSGGERQRIAIARAVLQDPAILILDEATSVVDSETEKAIQEAIESLVASRTTIAIAHRLATLRKADRLMVIDDGRVAEQGSHEELLRAGGMYAKLVSAQAEMNRLYAAVHVA